MFTIMLLPAGSGFMVLSISGGIRMATLRMLGLMLALVLATGSARAHFVWVAHENGDGNDPEVRVYFGESAQPDAAKHLDMVTRLNVWHRGAEEDYASLDLHRVESDGKGWFRGDLPSNRGVIEATCLFGVFSHGDRSLLLNYYAKSLKSDAQSDLSRSRKLDLDVVPQLIDGAMMIGVFWNGQPLEGSQVVVSPPKGEPLELETDSRGVASLKAPLRGAYQIRARQIVKESGEFDGRKYDEAQHYSTLTFAVAEAGADTLSGTESLRSTQDIRYPDLPRGITSFGAAVIGDRLYVYGGHFGRPHHYSNTSQSDELSRLNLSKDSAWEVIATGPRLQGLAMVAHGGKLYRVGGFTAHNEEDDDHDLRSVADFVRFHPETGKWEPLPSLPEPRSSHDAVVIGDKLYVAGGWRLGGEKPEVAPDGLGDRSFPGEHRLGITFRAAFPAASGFPGTPERQAVRHRRYAAEGWADHQGRCLRPGQRPVVPGAEPDRPQGRRRPRQGDGRLRLVGLHCRRSPVRQHLRRQCPGSGRQQRRLAHLGQA